MFKALALIPGFIAVYFVFKTVATIATYQQAQFSAALRFAGLE